MVLTTDGESSDGGGYKRPTADIVRCKWAAMILKRTKRPFVLKAKDLGGLLNVFVLREEIQRDMLKKAFHTLH